MDFSMVKRPSAPFHNPPPESNINATKVKRKPIVFNFSHQMENLVPQSSKGFSITTHCPISNTMYELMKKSPSDLILACKYCADKSLNPNLDKIDPDYFKNFGLKCNKDSLELLKIDQIFKKKTKI